jgi:XTP/dITP diphosphohydrolase
MREIMIATKNRGKVAEFSTLFSRYGIQVTSLFDFAEEIKEIEETGTTFAENAQLKAETIATLLQKPVIADDSGLVVPSLDDRPGVYSARFAGEPKDDGRNNEKLLMELADKHDRTAYFMCVLAFSVPNKKTIFTEGTCYGEIAITPRGTNGFGYDPLFIPKGYEQTMAELSSEEKNRISHRSRALKQLEETLVQHGILGDRHE